MKQEIHRLIARGDTQAALDKLSECSDQLKNDAFQQEVVLLSAKYSAYKRAERTGSNSTQELGRMVNNLHQQLLALTSYLEEDRLELKSSYHGPSFPPPRTSRNRHVYLVLLLIGVVLTVAAGYFVLRGNSAKAVSSVEAPITTLRVYVHEAGDKSNYPIQGEGEIILIVNERSYSASIGTDGLATFTDISLSPKDELQFILQAEGYRIANNTNPSVIAGEPLLLPVEALETKAATVAEHQVTPKETPSTTTSASDNTPRETVKEPSVKKEVVPAAPPPTPAQVTVRCLTEGIGDIAIWFYDQNGNKYEKTTRAGAADVSFKIPVALTQAPLTVHFKRMPNGNGDKMDILLSPGTPFQIPRSVRN